MTFESPWALALLIPYAAVLFFAWRRREPSIVVPGVSPFIAAAGGVRRWNWRKLLPFLCLSLAGAAMILALARPRNGLTVIQTKAEGIDIMIALDLSGSMSAFDPRRGQSARSAARDIQSGELRNRLETAKTEIRRFIEARPNDRIGLIAFADLPYIVSPPTLDHGYLLANLARLEPQMIGDGTGIASPLANAVRNLKDSTAKSRVLVLFTDGMNTVNGRIAPLDAGSLAKTFGVTIYTVGIGSPDALIPQETLAGTHLVRYPMQFDEPLMRELADMTGGRYYRAADADGMAAAMREIDSLEKTSMKRPEFVVWKEWHPALSFVAAGLLLLWGLLHHGLCRRIP